MGRLRYYREKSQGLYQRVGFWGLFTEVVGFLIRRRFFLGFIFESIEYQFFSRLRNIDLTLIRTLKQQPITASKVLLYASYDSNSVIQPHVVDQLSFFSQAGYQIVWVSTSNEVSVFEFNKIHDFVKIALLRSNEGYDFASWRLGYELVKDLKIDSLIMMNDSCLGPAFDFTPLLQRMEILEDVAYGITKSYEIAPYLQSYFIHFGRKLIESGLVRRYFNRIRILKSKWGIVRFFEIGGSQFLENAGIELRALVDPKDAKVATVMSELKLTDPVRDPAGKKWVELGLNPFWKRSNLKIPAQ